MPYATQSNLIERFGKQELVDILPGEGPETINDSLVLVALEDASNEIDSYLAERYTLPLDVVPPILVQVACDVARYKYYACDVTDEVEKRYTARLEWLGKVAEGDAGLGISSEPAGSLGGGFTKKSQTDRIYTCDSLRGF